MSGPTPYSDLNDVLRELLAGAREALGANFCGLYLQGSFAVGDADEHSDVDFVAVTNDAVAADELARLQSLHARLYALPSPWAQHLEGSYVPRRDLRREDDARYWFLDNGAVELVLDTHCNTALVRWVLREHGINLAGPDPATLVDPVSPEQLRAEALALLDEYVAWAPEPTNAGRMSRWKQPYLVTTYCRILHTIDSGRIVSKRAALEWARDVLPPDWRSLVQRALDDRPDPWQRVHEQAADEAVEQTLAFGSWAASATRTRSRTH
jgi:predicted nucleotidyltransferase